MIFMAGAFVGTSPAWGAPPVPAPAALADAPTTIQALIARLDAPSPSERALAEAALANHPETDLHSICELMQDPGLSPEQRRRLMNVGWRLFLAHPRAAMGISFGGELDGLVRINSTHEPFDSARVLQAGDVIDAMDGRPIRAPVDGAFTAQNDLQIEILSRLPKERLHITGLRRGEAFEGEIELGQWSSLNQAGQPDEGLLRQAWLRRVHRLGLDRPSAEHAAPTVIEAATQEVAAPNSYEAFELRLAASGRAGQEFTPAVSVVGPDASSNIELDPRFSHAGRVNIQAHANARLEPQVQRLVIQEQNVRVAPLQDPQVQQAMRIDQLRRQQQGQLQQAQNIERMIEQIDRQLEGELDLDRRTSLIQRRESYIQTVRSLQISIDATENQIRVLSGGIQQP